MKILLQTEINAPIERVFDLARSIDLHTMTTEGTNERAIAGPTGGLAELNDTVTWRAKHFGIYQNLTSKIVELDRPTYFISRMLKGAFKSINHIHYFQRNGPGTLMIDEFDFETPMGVLGKLTSNMLVKQYMTRLLENRNKGLKKIAEGKHCKSLLTGG